MTPPTSPQTYARRTDPFQESVIREMTRLCSQVDALNLSQGLPEFETPPAVLDAAVAAIRAGDNQYPFTFGAPALRQAIARKTAAYNRIPTDPDTQVTVTCGVSEATVCAVLALTDPGDEAIIFQPWYENYVPACRLAGVSPRFVPLHEPAYTFDPAELRAAFNRRTRLVFLTNPHNPTGRVFSRPELETIAQLCQEFDAIAVVDEIYEYILLDDRAHISLGSLAGMENRTVTLTGLGKTYAVTGWRVGWAVAAPPLTARIRKVHDYLTICAPGPFQAGGVAALNLPDEYYTAMRREYAARRAILLAGLSAGGFIYPVPQGAYYVMADFSQIRWDPARYARPEWSLDRTFAEYLARDIGVAVVPGSSFYAGAGEGHTRVRFNFAKTPATLQAAARRLEQLNREF